jgi:hypothetical protein
MSPAETLLNFLNRRDISAKDIDLAFEVSGPDIGVRLAEKILAEREELGGFFRNIKELDETPGLGARKMKFMLDFAGRTPERLDDYLGSVRPTETPNIPQPTSVSVESVAPNVLPTIGGTRLLIKGTFISEQKLRVFISKSVKRTLCYSGVPGDGEVVTSTDGKHLRVIAPALVAGTGYDLELEREETVLNTDGTPVLNSLGEPEKRWVFFASLTGAISVVAANYGSGVFSSRNLFPGWAATGPRTVSAT